MRTKPSLRCPSSSSDRSMSLAVGSLPSSKYTYLATTPNGGISICAWLFGRCYDRLTAIDDAHEKEHRRQRVSEFVSRNKRP